MSQDFIIYEQPLNEIMRVCLRFEYLFAQVRHYLNGKSMEDHRVALNYLIELLNLADRSDLRTKLSKAVSEHTTTLSQLKKIPDIDSETLQEVLDKLARVSKILHRNQGKIGQELRGNEFLFSVGQRFSTPGGAAPFYLAPYHLWLNLPEEKRKENLKDWFDTLLESEEVINLLLSLTRDSTDFSPQSANGGFYQLTLDPTVSYQMLRLKLKTKEKIYPEISVGRHRMAVHFYMLDVSGHAKQVRDLIEFELACCRV